MAVPLPRLLLLSPMLVALVACAGKVAVREDPRVHSPPEEPRVRPPPNEPAVRCIAGGAPVVVSPAGVAPQAVGVDDRSIYWTTMEADLSPEARRVWRAPKVGGDAAKVGDLPAPYWPTRLVIDDRDVWAFGQNDDPHYDSHVFRASKTGGGFVDATGEGWPTLDGDVTWLVRDNGVVRWDRKTNERRSIEGHPFGFAVNGSSVFWTEPSGDSTCKVFRLPKDGAGKTTLVREEKMSYGLAVDDTSVFWTRGWDSPEILSAPLSGGAPRTIARGQAFVARIVRDGASLYWADTAKDGSGALWRAGSDGGSPPITIGRARYPLFDFALDETCAYFSDRGVRIEDGARLVRVPK